MIIDKSKFKTKDGEIYPCKDNLIPMKEILDSKGCGFCLAKWSQVTMHLGSGLNHSCHHVNAHKIPLDELEKNIMALHNTAEKKQARIQMLNNERPSECDYCWRIEDNTNEISDRVYKSLEQWSLIDIDKIINSKGHEDVYPRYVEISFSNVCNFKCSYCGPSFSSKWTEEVKQHGPYNLLKTRYNQIDNVRQPIPNRQHNPYIDAFWKWFPNAVTHMKVFRITGGEPLLDKKTIQVMQYLLDNPQPLLEFAVNTNACVSNETWDKFVSLAGRLTVSNSVKRFTVFVSAESLGPQAEYSRDGMDWGLFKRNIKKLLRDTEDIDLIFMSAFNIFSLPSFMDFLQFINLLKKQNQKKSIKLNVSYVRHPEFLDIKIATLGLIKTYLEPCVEYVSNNTYFDNREYQLLNRILIDCNNRFKNESQSDNVGINRYRFTQFIKQYDYRRNKSFLKVFPEYANFWDICLKS